ncbi:melanopsin-like [Actinia tenebrosa]|uniref:Melanopsin-like n=1 Tax=Actinia tenebrosa TaxID=6105 RepID=A0A6P8HC11_ACTTE|nr:melanopsin-like [Actinia tenebrosa]
MPTDLLELHYYQAISVYFSVLSVLAFLLNSGVVIIFLGNRSLLTSSNYLYLSMAFSDLLRAMVVLPVAAYANYKYWWMVDKPICQYFAFSSTLLGLSSMVHLVALALQRWIALKTAAINEVAKRKMALFVAGLWLYSFIWSVCPLVGWSSFGPELGYSGCSINWHSSVTSDKVFILCLFILFFFIPVALSTFCYISIYIVVRKMAKNAVQRWGNVARPTQETIQAKAKTIKMSLVMLVAFLVAWGPYAVVSMYSSFTSATISPLLCTLPSLFAKLSSSYNPIIYFFMFSKFRKAGKKMLTKLFAISNVFISRHSVVVLPMPALSQPNKGRVDIQLDLANPSNLQHQKH